MAAETLSPTQQAVIEIGDSHFPRRLETKGSGRRQESLPEALHLSNSVGDRISRSWKRPLSRERQRWRILS